MAGNTLLARWRMRTRVEVLKSNKTGDPGAASFAKVPRSVLKEFFQTGGKPTQEQRLADGGAFFDVVEKDETFIVERFSADAAEPPAQETTVAVLFAGRASARRDPQRRLGFLDHPRYRRTTDPLL